jgi:predicted O-methyltransferase YrrM
MGKIVPDAVEGYLAGLNHLPDEVLLDVAKEGARRKLPLVDAEVGALLHVQATAIGARRILEIGTAIGYSGIWLARALPPDGMLITFELDPGRAAEARANFNRAGVGDRANVMVGDAAMLIAKVSGPFDLIFQDGAKQLYEPLLDTLIALLRPRGLLITDNVLREGEVVPGFTPTPQKDSRDTEAVGSYNKRLSSETRLLTAWLPIRDGMAISVKLIKA